jgi:AraC-like DNA-binding protein
MRPPVTIHPPSRRLAADVLCFVLRRASDAATPPALFPATFYGGLTVVHRGAIRDAASGQPLPPVTLSSGHTRPLRLVCDAGTVASSVVFKPGRLPALCGGRAPVRANTFVDAATVWPAAVHGGLRQALTAAAGDIQRLQVLETFLRLRQAAAGAHVDPFEARLAPLFGQLGTMQVARLSEQLALAPRSLQRRFRDRYGMAPKTFIRLARLHDALRRVQAGPGRQRPGWAQLAGQCGFADQAHLLREFKALTGHTPVALLALLDAPDGAAWAFRIPPETLDWAAAPATAASELALA